MTKTEQLTYLASELRSITKLLTESFMSGRPLPLHLERRAFDLAQARHGILGAEPTREESLLFDEVERNRRRMETVIGNYKRMIGSEGSPSGGRELT